ncbi:MAG: FMN-binding protein [Prevotella sp.]|jgi:electron transport complex protein RnfG|nr:FMN-binding protein [Prevotella sp.]
MKKYVFICLAAVVLMSAGKQDGTITKENGSTIVNTTTIAKDVEGYNGPVPLKIYIKKNKIEKIEVLKNQETPKYLVKVKNALENAWDGLTVKEAKAKKVDAVTGATYTSEAIIKNVQKGLDHYQKNK